VQALSDALRELGVPFEREVILRHRTTGAWCIADFMLPQHAIVIELDGAQHRLQRGYDAGRDRWIEEFTGCRVIRRWNTWATEPALRGRMAALLQLN
jgi:very-short-patch-repair endonuclease